MSNKPAGFRASEMDANFRERQMALPLVVRCALCEWTVRGTAREVLEAQRDHFLGHGLARSSRRRSRHVRSPLAPPLTGEDKAEIEREIRRRALETGVEL